MRGTSRTVVSVTLGILLATVPMTVLASPTGGKEQAPLTASLQLVRATATGEFGVTRPSGLAWNGSLGALLVVEGRRLLRVAPDATPEGSVTLPGSPDPSTLASDPVSGSTAFAAGSQLFSLSRADLAGGSQRGSRSAHPFGVERLEALTFDSSGALVGLDRGALLRMKDGRPVRTPVVGAEGHDLRGLTTWPGSTLVYTFDQDSEQLLGIDPTGKVARTLDASSLNLGNVTGIAVAPSADHTDSPSVQNLYVADAGDTSVQGQVVEATLETSTVETATTNATLVRAVQTSAYSPPSPDPSGLAYLPGADRLFMADGEVDEMPIFQGSNLFSLTRDGSVASTSVSQPWSNEPVGVGYNASNNHLFVSDDDQKEVFELVAGADGRFGTSDDTVTHFDTAGSGNTDPEGIDYDTATASLWVADGVNTQVYRYRAGPDGRVGTSDDIRTNFDVGVYGARDPEGLAYDSVRDTILIVDDGSRAIYEFDKTGSLLNIISIAGFGVTAAAGLAVAPGSTNPAQRNYYVVARGLDNDSHPTENDGMLYEFSATLSPVETLNRAPLVDAGPDQSVVLPDAATLDGTVSDDGLPVPPGAVTTTWTEVSGFGTVTFGDPNAVDTTATFSSDGTYVLRLTASDGEATTADDITVLVRPPGSGLAVEVPLAAGSDDAEQTTSGFVALTSADLELVTDGSTVQTVGTRFAGVGVPAGATITRAYIQFRTDEVSVGEAPLTIRAEASDNPPTYQAVNGNVTARAVTASSVPWSPPDWNTVGERAQGQRTADLSPLVQSLVSRPGWASGNAMAFQFTGSGRRTAFAFEGGAASAPLLHLEYTTDGEPPPPVNSAPAVSAGPDRAIQPSETTSLDGTVTDDGLPNPPGAVTTTWSKASGPGNVTFGDVSAVDTTARFDAEGSYVLRLTASDGELSQFDETTVTVSSSTTGTIDVRVATGSDDAEQSPSGFVGLTSADLELVTDGNTVQTVGVRFAGVQVPAGAAITRAWMQFRADEVSTDAASLTIRAEAADSAPTYQSVNSNITSRAVTTVSVPWTPPAWNVVNEASAAQQTPDLSALVQAVVDRPGWSAGNAVAMQVSGTGRRTADSFDGSWAPLLHVEFSTGGTPPPPPPPPPPPENTAPTVNAGPDQAVFLPASGSLDGTVTDDGLPDPPAAVTTTWSSQSGPGSVTFGDPNAVDTSATFSAAGTYVLRLSASDSALSSFDEVTVTVHPVGTPQPLAIPIRAGNDDAEERYNGSIQLSSADLSLTQDGKRFHKATGLRFTGVPLPRGAVVTRAYVQFRADEVGTGAAALTVRAQAADNAPAFTSATGYLSTLPTTAASASWAPPDWSTVGAEGTAQRTSDLAAMVQEVVNRPGWASGNALALVFTGTANRTATALEGPAPATLHIEWHT